MKCPNCNGERVVDEYPERLREGASICRDCQLVFTPEESRMAIRIAELKHKLARRDDIIRRLRDICHWLTPAVVYNLLGDDAATALGYPLSIGQFKGDTSALIDLSWADPTREEATGGAT